MPEILFQRDGDRLTASMGERRTDVPWEEVAPTPTTAQRVRQDPVGFGLSLFQRVLATELGDALTNSRTGERLVLRIADPAIAEIPWEYLRDEGGLLALRYAMVRAGGAAGADGGDVRTEHPLQIVAVPASPVDHPQALMVDQEYGGLVETVKGAGKEVRLVRVRPPTTSRLEQALRPDTATLVHFMGHGEAWGGKSVLVFEDEQGRTRRVAAGELADVVQSQALLVVLNSCLSAAGQVAGLGNIAHDLVWRGIPYVLGMGSPLPDGAAPKLSQTLFAFLLGGWSVEDAVRRTRRSLLDSPSPLREWLAGVPVLYTSRSRPLEPLRLVSGVPVIHPDPQRLEQSVDLSDLPAARHFVGRGEEIAAASAALLSEENADFVVLHGLGGVGKTALARRVAERVGWHYGDRVLGYSFERFAAVQRDGSLAVNPAFAEGFYFRLARFYGLDPTREEFLRRENDQPIGLLNGILQQRKYTRSLLVLDNVETLFEAMERGDPAALMLGAFVRRLDEGEGDILLTSRTLPPSDWGPYEAIAIEGLDELAGAELFLAWLDNGRKATTLAAERRAVVRRVGGHPLSVRLLAARYNEGIGTLAAFLRDVEQELAVAEQNTPDSFLDHERQRTLYACMAYSVRRLGEPERIVLRAVALFQRTFTEELALGVAGDPERSRPHLGRLVRLGLLGSGSITLEDGSFLRLEIHPTVRWYAGNYLEEPSPELERSYGHILHAVAVRVHEEYDRSPRFRRLVTDSLADFDVLLASSPGRFLTRDALADVAHALAMVYHQQGQPKRALRLYEQALGSFEAAGCEREVARAKRGLGSVVLEQGDADRAEALFCDALESFTRLGDGAEIVATTNVRASAIRSRGRPQDALNMRKEALATAEALRDLGQIVTTRREMANDLVQLGQPHQAMALFREAREHLAGVANDAELVQVQSGMATVLRQLWKSEEALDVYRDALATFHRLENDSAIASTESAIADLLARQGSLDEAMALYRKVEQRQEELGEQYALLTTRTGIAEVFQHQGSYAEALSLYAHVAERALALGDKRSAALARSGMANVCFARGEMPEASSHFEAALQALGEQGDPRERAVIQNNFGNLLLLRDEVGRGLALLWDSWQKFHALGFEYDLGKLEEYLSQVKRDTPDFDVFWKEAVQAPQPEWLRAVPEPDLSDPDDALRAFIEASAASARRLLRVHPEVYFGSAVDELLQLRVERASAEGADEEARRLKGDLAFLRSARAERLAEVAASFVRAERWEESRSQLEEEKALLLSDEAEAWFQSAVEQARSRGNDSDAAVIERHLALVRQARSLGTGNAFSLLLPPDGTHAPLTKVEHAVLRFLATQSWEEARREVEAERGFLLQDGAEETLQRLIAGSDPTGHPDVGRWLATHLEVLRSIREIGVDATLTDIEGVLAGRARRRNIERRLRPIAVRADYEELLAEIQREGVEAVLGALEGLILHSGQRELVIGGVAILRRMGGEEARAAFLRLFAGDVNRRSRDLYLQALRELSVGQAQPLPELPSPPAPSERVRIHIGSGLVPLFDPREEGPMLRQIGVIRNQLEQEAQFRLPPVRVTDDYWLDENQLEVMLDEEMLFSETLTGADSDPEMLGLRLKNGFIQQRERFIVTAS